MKASEARLCYITDRHALQPRSLLSVIAIAAEAGVDLVQIREKDLPTRALLDLVASALAITRGTATRIVVNDRLDVALAAGADGVHLGGQSISVEKVRSLLGPFAEESLCVGVSCHSVADVQDAETGGASYALLGPIFETPSKRIYGPPLGANALAQAAQSCRVPIVALGGLTQERARECIEAGASGVAGISMFQQTDATVERLRLLRHQIEAFAAARPNQTSQNR